MAILSNDQVETEGLMQVANLMVISARTAPKAHGDDDILTMILTGKEKDSVADEMDKRGNQTGIENWKRDADNVKMSCVLVLIGVDGFKSIGVNCGGCGFKNCKEFKMATKNTGTDYDGQNCVFKVMDLGIALGSAVKTASMMNVDNRMFFHAGAAAKRLGFLKCSLVVGIPISATGKNVFFDRRYPPVSKESE